MMGANTLNKMRPGPKARPIQYATFRGARVAPQQSPILREGGSSLTHRSRPAHPGARKALKPRGSGGWPPGVSANQLGLQ